MLIGVPKEIKDSEYRVGLVPSTVRELTRNGHHVIVEAGAGLGAGIADADYRAVGAEIVSDADQIFATRRADREGQGTAGDRAQETPARTSPLHLSASGR